MIGVSCTPAERGSLKKVLDLLSHANHTKRQDRAGEALGGGEDVGHDAREVLEGEEGAGPPEAAHHLVKNEEDLVLVAESTDTLQVADGVQENTIGTDDGLQKDRSNALGTLADDLLLQHTEGLLSRSFVAGTSGKAEGVRVEDLHKTWHLPCKARPKVPSGGEGTGRATMVGSHGAEDLELARVSTRDSDGSLVGLAASQGEEEAVDVARSDVAQEAAELGSNRSHAHTRVGVEDLLHLLDDGIFHIRIQGVASVGADGLAGVVEVLLAFAVVQVHPFATDDVWNAHPRRAVGPSHDDVVAHGLLELLWGPLVPHMLLAHLPRRVVDARRLGDGGAAQRRNVAPVDSRELCRTICAAQF
mmetsp:Transcript_89154/g.186301  ORF Transcript_89154/g.186301 Transcript_89154/m.186301 type:complete len:360 (+) Transcript_89154:629-1708(+)